MPFINDVSLVNLDLNKFLDNNSSMFVYFNFPSAIFTFNGMVADSNGRFYNTLNFGAAYTDPNIYISTNKNFTSLDSYTTTNIAITQRIHTSIRLNKGTQNDLEMIFSMSPTKSNNNSTSQLFFICYLTLDTSSSTNGGDFNTLFNKLSRTDLLQTQANDFETMNLKNYQYPLFLDKGIISQFGNNSTDPNTNLCYSFKDSQENIFIIMQPPILVNSVGFNAIQKYLQLPETKVITTPLGAYFPNTDLTPAGDLNTNILLKTYNTLVADVKQNPYTPSEYAEKQKEDDLDKQGKAAEDVNKLTLAKQGFTVMEGFKEGAEATSKPQTSGGNSVVIPSGKRSFSCHPADSNNNLSSQLVTDQDPNTADSTAAMESVFGTLFAIGSVLMIYMFAPEIYTTMLVTKSLTNIFKIENFSILPGNDFSDPLMKDRIIRLSKISCVVGWLCFLNLIILWSIAMFSNNLITSAGRYWMFLIGILLFGTCLLNTLSLKNSYNSGDLLKQIKLKVESIPNAQLGIQDDNLNSYLSKVFKETDIYKWVSID